MFRYMQQHPMGGTDGDSEKDDGMATIETQEHELVQQMLKMAWDESRKRVIKEIAQIARDSKDVNLKAHVVGLLESLGVL